MTWIVRPAVPFLPRVTRKAIPECPEVRGAWKTRNPGLTGAGALSILVLVLSSRTGMLNPAINL